MVNEAGRRTPVYKSPSFCYNAVMKREGKKTIQQDFAERTAGRIIRGELAPGDRLPTEREIAEKEGISKSAVHFALVELERMGFVKTVQRHGTYVADFSRTGTIETLNLLLQFSGGDFPHKHTQDMLDMRMAIEGKALELLGDSLDEDSERELGELVREAADYLEQEETEERELAGKFFRFHHRICVASGNFILPLLFNTFEYTSIIYWQKAIEKLGPRACVESMKEFYEILLQRDPSLSLDYMRREFDMFMKAIV